MMPPARPKPIGGPPPPDPDPPLVVTSAGGGNGGLGADGIDLGGGTPQEFGTLIRTDIAKWSKVIKAAGIKPE